MKKFLVLVLLLSIGSCDFTKSLLRSDKKIKSEKTETTIVSKKKSDFNYQNAWKEVYKYIEKSLPKSALKSVNDILSVAREENNEGQIIKALIHKIRYIQDVEEETFVKIQKSLKDEVKSSRYPLTPVLHSMIAEQYWNYYRRNRWKFLKRSATVNFKQDDMRTWDLKKIVETVVHHYQESLKDADKLKKTKINIYDEVLYTGNMKRKYRPTLYDFLAHRAIDFYMNNEAGLTKPVYQFTINNNAFFSDYNKFAKLKIKTKDPLSFHFYTLSYLQDLIKFHQDDKEHEALIDVDLKRLKFVYKKAVIPNKEIIYERILKRMIDKHQSSSASAEIYYELANLYSGLGDKYKPEYAKQYKWYKKKAHKICRNTIKAYPKSIGANNSRHLLNKIESKAINTTIEEVQIPGKSFRALLKYRNSKKLFFKVVKTNRKEKREKRGLHYKEMIKYYYGKSSIKAWNIVMPDDGDFQNHSAEIMVPGLKPGKYILMAANSKNFDLENNAVTYHFFDVSSITFIQRRRNKTGLEFHVVNRETGAALKKARVQLWYQEWSRWRKKYIYTKGKLFKVNKNGYFNITYGTSPKSYFYLEFINGKERFFPDDDFYAHRSYDRHSSRTRTYFYTDRAIYRPGQTVYFKGIQIHVDNRDGEKNRIIPKSSSHVTLYDVNGQKVSDLLLRTNEYGTFSGTFRLPMGLLNGNFSISDGYGRHYFSVEEYKRPKFEVKFDPSKESSRLDDMVTIAGNAKAYAGFAIDNAIVKYRVVRNVFYPYRWYYWGYSPPSSQMQILSGTAKTDSKGEFKIRFKAIPDLSISKATMPAFRYTVSVDITDVNGETRSAGKSVSIGYSALKLYLSFVDKLAKEKNAYKFTINSTNLSNEFIKARGNIIIHKLQAPERILRTRLWNKADRFTLKKDTYHKNFPNDIRDDENNYHKWKRIKKVFSYDFDTGKKKKILLKDFKSWQSGRYVVEMKSKDSYGNRIREISYFTLYSKKGKHMPGKLLNWLAIPKTTVLPGNNAEVIIGSSDKNVRVLYELEHRGRITKRKYLILNNAQKRIVIPIKEKHRGNLGLHFTFIKHNRIYSQSRNIYVPWSNKELDISFETFRSKLFPGQKEEWRLKIKGSKSDMVASEMVATLYDASLDSFRHHGWNFSIFPNHYARYSWSGTTFGIVNSSTVGKLYKYTGFWQKSYDRLNWFGFYWRHYYRGYGRSGKRYKSAKKKNGDEPAVAEESKEEAERDVDDEAKPGEKSDKLLLSKKAKGKAGEDLSKVKARTNFNETAFFYPHLKTNEKGEIIITFNIPEALTRWKMLGFAHTKNLEYGFIQNELITQKDLMVVPNAPRFFREKDSMIFTAKVTNLSESALTGKAALYLFDAATMKPVDIKFKNAEKKKSFESKKGQSSLLSWKIKIPEDLEAVTYRVVARAGNFSDGEEKALPILKNRMMVTESIPLPVRSKQTKRFKFKKLLESKKSSTLRHHKLTLEFTSNPAWYAVQALPYLMEYPYECLEQTFSRYYANTIASYIVNRHPRIKKIFDRWAKSKDSNALLSNLEKNQELKSLLLEETPWVMNAKNETQRKKRIALLFDLNRMGNELGRAMKKLSEGQSPSGAWPWFKGMRESRYITQHIVTGFAHLEALKVVNVRKKSRIWNMVRKAVPYLDRKIREDYEYLIRKKINLKHNHLGFMQIHYLYARSYFQDIPLDKDTKKAFEYYRGQAKQYWHDFNLYMKGMISLALNRYDEKEVARSIIKSIKEHALYSEEMGMYWKSSYGYHWYQAPIETHALLIEAFSEVVDDKKSVDDLKTWLLKQKQTQDWRTTKATADACFALLLKGGDWLAQDQLAEITLGNIKVDPTKMENVRVEAGTGYFKTSWSAADIVPEMGKVTVVNKNDVVAWGGLYWQYFEDLDKITPHETPLKLKKRLFVERSSATGPVLHPINKEDIVIGDRIKVRIELRVDRTMEYVHMKDMRASAFEPENVISRYKWQDNLGYYESTKDASTNFFFDYLPKGTYVFEYPMRVTHRGNFSNGITTIQCMYAPEFSSHSEGVRVRIE